MQVSFWQLQRRAQLMSHVLLGYYLLPASPEEPIQAFVCPAGSEERSKKRVWNTGAQGRLKFLILMVCASSGCNASGFREPRFF